MIQSIDQHGERVPLTDPVPKVMARRRWPLGFTTATSFFLYILFTGYMARFVIRRWEYVNGLCKTLPDGRLVAASRLGDGECVAFGHGTGQLAMGLHVAGAMAISVLFPLQLLPRGSKLFVLIHRYNGWLLTILSIVCLAGMHVIGRDAFGGSIGIRYGSPVFAVVCLVAMGRAILYARNWQFDRHRAWMVRGWAWSLSILLMRPLMAILAISVSRLGSYHRALSCEFIAATIPRDEMETFYPECHSFLSGQTLDQWIAVRADVFGPSMMGLVAATHVVFEPAAYISVILGAAAAEFYLNLTTGEAARLRTLSEVQQKAVQRKQHSKPACPN